MKLKPGFLTELLLKLPLHPPPQLWLPQVPLSSLPPPAAQSNWKAQALLLTPLQCLTQLYLRRQNKALGHLQTCVLASKRTRHPRYCETRYGWLETGCVLQSRR